MLNERKKTSRRKKSAPYHSVQEYSNERSLSLSLIPPPRPLYQFVNNPWCAPGQAEEKAGGTGAAFCRAKNCLQSLYKSTYYVILWELIHHKLCGNSIQFINLQYTSIPVHYNRTALMEPIMRMPSPRIRFHDPVPWQSICWVAGSRVCSNM
jgi:hypothetical protein